MDSMAQNIYSIYTMDLNIILLVKVFELFSQ